MSNFHITSGVDHKQQQLAQWRQEANIQRQVKAANASTIEAIPDPSQTLPAPSKRVAFVLKHMAAGLKLW
jgi:hypothetical protein